MSWVDSVLKRFGYVSKKAIRTYAGAEWNRLTNDWITSSTSFDSEIRTSLRLLRNRARQLVRDNDYAKNAIRSIKNNVIGMGVRMQSQVKKRRGDKLDDNTNKAIEDAWTAWKKKSRCHVAGMLSFESIERLLVGETAKSGEIFVRMIKQRFGDSKIPFALEIIESDQLAEEYNLPHAENGNEIRMGVERDRWLRPVAYWMYPQHPGDYQFQTVPAMRFIRVPADEIIPLFIAEEGVNQTRGVPWFHSALRRMRNMAGYEEAEIIAARASACIMGFIETPDGDNTLADANNISETGERMTTLEAGAVEALGPGEKFSGFSPTRPNNAFEPFMRFMIRGMAAGIGGSYESISRDYSQSNYSSSRLAILDERDNWRVLQQWMIQNFHQIVFENWLEMAVLSGVLDLPDYEINRDRYLAPKWMPRGWSWVDPDKESKAAKGMVRDGFTTLTKLLSEQGLDFDETMLQRQHETDEFKRLGLVFDSDPSQVNDKGMVQQLLPVDAGGEDPVEEPEDGKPAATGGSGGSSN